MNESQERKTSVKTKKNVRVAIKDEKDDIGEYAKSAKMARKVGVRYFIVDYLLIGIVLSVDVS